eukprot:252817_1
MGVAVSSSVEDAVTKLVQANSLSVTDDFLSQTFMRLVANIESSPKDPCYCRIRIGSDRFKRRLQNVKHAVDLLRAMGWEERNNMFYIDTVRHPPAEMLMCVGALQRALDARKGRRSIDDDDEKCPASSSSPSSSCSSEIVAVSSFSSSAMSLTPPDNSRIVQELIEMGFKHDIINMALALSHGNAGKTYEMLELDQKKAWLHSFVLGEPEIRGRSRAEIGQRSAERNDRTGRRGERTASEKIVA